MSDRPWTPSKIAKRERDNAKLRQRIATIEEGRKGCWVFGCQRRAGRAVAGSLGRFCEQHADAYRRHGSPLRPSYKASETNPNRRAALAWLKANRTADWVVAAVSGVEGRYRAAGRSVAANSVRGLATPEKANAVWARLRAAQVDPLYVVAAVIGVTLTFEQDTQRPSAGWGVEYRRVQIAKVLNRMAGGTVKRWARDPVLVDDGVPRLAVPPPRELRAFQSSSGRMLRTLGKQAETACELLLAYDLAEISAYAATVPITKASLKTPWPDRHRAKPKPRIPREAKPTGPFAVKQEAEKRKRRQREKEKKAAALASIVTPEQDKARQPTVKVFKNGRWVDDPKGGA